VVGSSFVVRVGAVAHGGFCVARHEGRVIFVRHTLPGELVRVSVTEGKANSSYWRADAVEVVEPAEGRVELVLEVGSGRQPVRIDRTREPGLGRIIHHRRTLNQRRRRLLG
jgi:predicted RNA-binding protein with TRAM domain